MSNSGNRRPRKLVRGRLVIIAIPTLFNIYNVIASRAKQSAILDLKLLIEINQDQQQSGFLRRPRIRFGQAMLPPRNYAT